MPTYDLNWAEQAREQVNSLPTSAKRAVMSTIADIQHDPRGRGVYDKTTDRYTADFTDGATAGLIVYIVGEHQLRIVILRVTALG